MLEDVNNILNSGDVPNLYGPEEMDRIMTACRPICAKKRIPATKLNVFAQVGHLHACVQASVNSLHDTQADQLARRLCGPSEMKDAYELRRKTQCMRASCSLPS